MNKLFYTDPLKAAYMAREFGVTITAPVQNIMGELEQSEHGIPMWCWGRIIEQRAKILPLRAAKESLHHRYIVKSDSDHIFEPKEGDVLKLTLDLIMDEYDGEAPTISPIVKYMCTDLGWDELPTIRKASKVEIIMRNDKPFFMPEKEIDND